MKLQINTYALVKDFFRPAFEFELQNNATITDLRDALIKWKPESSSILSRCRFAIGDTLVGDNEPLHESSSIHIIPPSSGG